MAPAVQVLLVEDDAAIRTSLTRSLRDQGLALNAGGLGLPPDASERGFRGGGTGGSRVPAGREGFPSAGAT